MSEINNLEELREKINSREEDVETTVVEEAPVEEVVAVEEEEVAPEEKPVEEVAPEEVADEEEEIKPEEEVIPAEGEPYVPNLKYGSMGEEKEFDPFVAAAITTPEQEEAVRRLYQKANGLEHLTQRNEQLKAEVESFEPVKQRTTQLETEISGYNQMMNQGQFHEFFRKMNISDNEVLKVANSILTYNELTPEQKRDYDNGMQSNQRVHQLELENQQLQEQVGTSNVTDHVTRLDQVLTENAETVTAYDARLGQGAFRQAVIDRAALKEIRTKGNKDGPVIMSPEEAVNEYLTEVKKLELTQAPTIQNPITEQVVTPAAKPVIAARKPVIPNVKAGNKSPAKKVITSIAQLRKKVEGLDEY